MPKKLIKTIQGDSHQYMDCVNRECKAVSVYNYDEHNHPWSAVASITFYYIHRLVALKVIIIINVIVMIMMRT